MSRTFRRKGYEKTQGTTWDRRGDKVAGYYTQSDWELYWNIGYDRYRVPTRQEYYEQYWRNHRDSHRNRWSPGRYHRKSRDSQNRSITKRELNKWIKNPDYEPLVEANPRSCLWDWS